MESYEQIEMRYLKKCHRHCHLRHAHRTANTLPPLSHFRVFIVILCTVAMRSRKFCVNAQRTPRKVHMAWLAQNS